MLAMLICNISVKSFEIILKNFYSLSAISKKIWGAKSFQFRREGQHFPFDFSLMPFDLAGMN